MLLKIDDALISNYRAGRLLEMNNTFHHLLYYEHTYYELIFHLGAVGIVQDWAGA